MKSQGLATSIKFFGGQGPKVYSLYYEIPSKVKDMLFWSYCIPSWRRKPSAWYIPLDSGGSLFHNWKYHYNRCSYKQKYIYHVTQGCSLKWCTEQAGSLWAGQAVVQAAPLPGNGLSVVGKNDQFKVNYSTWPPVLLWIQGREES